MSLEKPFKGRVYLRLGFKKPWYGRLECERGRFCLKAIHFLKKLNYSKIFNILKKLSPWLNEMTFEVPNTWLMQPLVTSSVFVTSHGTPM